MEAKIACSECGNPLNPNAPEGVYEEIVGWDKRRNQGGQNHVRLRKPTGRVMHVSCMTRLLNGIATQQSTFF